MSTKLPNIEFNQAAKDYLMSTIDKHKAIESKVAEIIKFLGLTPLKSDEDMAKQLENALKIHKYIAQNSSYNSKIMKDKEKMTAEEGYTEELYNGFIRGEGICTTDAIMFKYLLSQIGMKADMVMLFAKDRIAAHTATLVEIDGEKYYFDTTQERRMNAQSKEDFHFYFAGFGSELYEQLYTAIGIFPDELKGNIQKLPSNIAQKNISRVVIDGIANGIQDLTFEKQAVNRELAEINSQVPIEKKDEAKNIISRLINKIRSKLQREADR